MQYWQQRADVQEKARADHENLRYNCDIYHEKLRLSCGFHHATICGDGELENHTCGT
jgi:hypothetical protein